MNIYSQNQHLQQPRLPADTPPAPRRLAGARNWLLLYIHVFGWIVVGGGATAFFSLGLLTTAFFFFSIPVGLWFGILVGIPGAAVLTVAIGCWANPPRDPRRLTLTLEVTGVVGALVGAFVAAWTQFPVGRTFWSFGLGAVANGVYAVIGVVLSGRWAGRRLAVQLLRSRALDAPPGMFDRPVRWLRRRGHTMPHPPDAVVPVADTPDADSPDNRRPPPPTVMVTPETPTEGTRSASTWADERRLMLTAWWWLTVGAAMNGAIAPGILGAFALGYGAIAGATVGAVTGVPVGVAIASWIRTHADLLTDSRRFTTTLEWIGAVGALVGCSIFVWSWAVPVTVGAETSATWLVVRTIAVVTGVALSGRWVGRRLAMHHLATRQLPGPRSWFALRTGDRRVDL